jgi:hypothetical protein
MAQTDAAAQHLPRQHRTDARRGRRDGRKQIPTYTSVLERLDRGEPISTGYEDLIKSRGRHKIDELLHAFWHAVDRLSRDLATLKGLRAMDEVNLENAEKAMSEARLELSESDLLPRNPTEVGLARTNPDELRARRAAERQRGIVAVNAELRHQREQVAARARAIAEAEELVQVEFVKVQARARAEHDRCLIRISVYWDALVQRHPEGRNLATTRPSVVLELPEWVRAERWDELEPPEETGP